MTKDTQFVGTWEAFEAGKRAGMEEEQKGGTNSISYLEGLKAGEILGAKEGYECGVYNGEAEGVAKGIKEVVDILKKTGWSNAADYIEAYRGIK